ncbi:uncharacterized protein [Diadema antillarum]|uniref:uncharacterized protein n=1 Tax=Diadema antillarum TaxID=105358 RepID=UPI003A87C924
MTAASTGHRSYEWPLNRVESIELEDDLVDGFVRESSRSASSCLDAFSCVSQSHLNTRTLGRYHGAWLAGHTDLLPWVQVDFSAKHHVVAVITQGEDIFPNWVTSYTVSHGNDGLTWLPVFSSQQGRTFTGNFDNEIPVANEFDPPFVARFVRLEPRTWHGHVALRFEFYAKGPIADRLDPARPLGMMDGQIPDTSVTSSSCYSRYFCASHARLNVPESSWLAAKNDYSQWIRADLGAVYSISGVMTQGQSNLDQWVTSFTLSHSVSNNQWDSVLDSCTGEPKVFVGNKDRNTPIVNYLEHPLRASSIRLEPKSWHRHIAMRFEVLGTGPVAEFMFESMQMGVENRLVGVESLSASSCLDNRHCADRARLNQVAWNGLGGAWMPAEDTTNQWVQVSLARPSFITGVVTQGMQEADHWVASFIVTHGINGVDFETVRNQCCSDPEVGVLSTRPLGLSDRSVADAQLTASSCWNSFQCANAGRLFMINHAWSPRTMDNQQWIQIDLRQSFRLEAIMTQGRDSAESWVTSFSISYSIDGYSWTRNRDDDGLPQVYRGNEDRESLAINQFHPSFVSRFVRVEPLTWHRHISLRFELFGAGPIPVIPNALGVEDFRIPDTNLHASSCRSERHCAERARLNLRSSEAAQQLGKSPANPQEGEYPGAWLPEFNDHNQWIGVDLRHKHRVAGIITQGREDADQWVTSFTVSYRNNNDEWTFVGDCKGDEKIFTGNYDRSTPIVNAFAVALTASSLRIHPKTWMRNIALRFELLGNGPTAEIGIDVNKLGMESHRIQDEFIAASSCATHDTCAKEARLNHPNAWMPRISDDAQWIQVDLRALYRVTGVVTQGRGASRDWVTAFMVLFSVEGGGKWSSVAEPVCGDTTKAKIFSGNWDGGSPMTNIFPSPVMTRYVLIAPLRWHNNIAIRFELLGDGPFLLPVRWGN